MQWGECSVEQLVKHSSVVLLLLHWLGVAGKHMEQVLLLLLLLLLLRAPASPQQALASILRIRVRMYGSTER
jgi:hypothetical protein